VLSDGSEVKLGVFLSNTQTRRAKLTADKLQALADLGLDWATVYRPGRATPIFFGFPGPPGRPSAGAACWLIVTHVFLGG
jgi:hypothetical protein